MEELDVEEGQQEVPSSSNSVDLPGRLSDLKPLVSFDLSKSSQDGHARHLSEDLSSLTINELRVKNKDQSFYNQLESAGISGHNHSRNFSVDIRSLSLNESRSKKAEDNCHNHLQGKTISRHNSAERNIFRAAEIAERFIQALDSNRVHVETASPIGSVKDAVSKFGGILDWKERRKNVQLTLDKVREEAPDYQRRLEVAQVEKSKVLQELCCTRRIIEGLKLNLEKTQTEAVQARQDSELAEIRLKETQQGIARKESAAVKAEIELAKERHATALADLMSVRDELEQLRKEHASLISHKEDVETRAHESTATSHEIERTVEDLTLRLISLKESLTSAHATHIIAEERRINVASDYQQEKDNWENEQKQADEEVQKLNDEISANRDVDSKLEDASTFLVNLRGEFTAYLEWNLPHVAGDSDNQKEQPMISVRKTLANTRKELEDMRRKIEKAKDEVKSLWNSAATLRAEIEKERGHLVTLMEKENHASLSASSLKEDLMKMKSELSMAHERIKAAGMPEELHQATQEASRAKAKAHSAHGEVAMARAEADRAKAEVNVAQLRLEATSREILAANASQEIAMASANALREYTHGAKMEPQDERRSNDIVTLPLEEYDMWSKRAQEADDQAKKQITKAVETIHDAKEAEVRSLDKLHHLTKQIDERKVVLMAAQEKAMAAQEHKLIMENELRKRRDKHEQESPSTTPAIANVCNMKNGSCSFDAVGSSASNPQIHGGQLPRADTIAANSVAESKGRKSFFPRSIVTMFTYRRKTQSM